MFSRFVRECQYLPCMRAACDVCASSTCFSLSLINRMGDVNRIFKSLILLYQHLLSLKEEEVLHPLLAVSFLYTRSCTRLDKLYNCCRIENSHRDGIYHCRTENLNPDVTWCEGQPCQQALCPAGSIALVEEEKTESFRNWLRSFVVTFTEQSFGSRFKPWTLVLNLKPYPF